MAATIKVGDRVPEFTFFELNEDGNKKKFFFVSFDVFFLSWRWWNSIVEIAIGINFNKMNT